MTTVPPLQAYSGSTPNDSEYYYSDNSKWTKDILVTRDPVFVNKAVVNGEYIGRKPHTYIYLAIAVTVLNPLLGPFAIMFAVMSTRSYDDGDIKSAVKWANYSFMLGMMTIGISVILYIAIGFSLSGLGTKGGHAP
ncbi:uncharacterized protein LOC110459944 [Mizuhopecten yessoensis]|uniref:Uncharacterized protein n=1 Tax=Mizuhopecten yessoensis TaxID=6573 RepID=A0A210Q3J2_MIZYE|nr:uncharacterized protein LOC110459944 [Mizuhopecten yessoensis]OWF43307.1 hypothetical protein KP79_PYT18743 [Mizuhopecten yessoensis]